MGFYGVNVGKYSSTMGCTWIWHPPMFSPVGPSTRRKLRRRDWLQRDAKTESWFAKGNRSPGGEILESHPVTGSIGEDGFTVGQLPFWCLPGCFPPFSDPRVGCCCTMSGVKMLQNLAKTLNQTQSMMTHDDSWWLMMTHDDSWWFMTRKIRKSNTPAIRCRMMRPLFRSLLSRNHEGHQCGEKHGAGAAGKVKLVAVGEW